MTTTSNLTGTNSAVGKYGPWVIFLAGWYVLPTGRARNLYLAAVGSALAGVFTTDLAAHADVEPKAWEWRVFIGAPTIWSWLLWALAVYLIVQLVRDVRQYRRLQLTAAVAPVAVEEPV